MKQYLSSELDFEAFKNKYYGMPMRPWAEESPKTYPTVIVYQFELQETKIHSSYNLVICYEFIYPNDFEITEDPERA